MSILSAVLLSAAMSADALFFGIAFGAKGIRIRGLSLAVITLTGFAVLMICSALGRYISDISNYGEAAGGLILIGVGMWLCSDCRGVLDEPERADMNGSKNIEPLEALVTGVALSIDSAAVVVGSPVGEFTNKVLPLTILFFQIIFIVTGMYKGNVLMRFIPKGQISLVSGIVVVFMGIYKLTAMF